MKLRDWLIAAGVFTAILLGIGYCHNRSVSQWEQRAREALTVSEQQRSRAEVFREEAERLRSQAVATADSAAAREPVIRERIVRLPPAETPGEERRDEIIAEQQVTIRQWRTAYERSQEAFARLSAAYDTAQARGDSLAAVLEDRPSGRPWYIPRLGVGPAAGYNQDDGVHLDPMTVHVSWEVRF